MTHNSLHTVVCSDRNNVQLSSNTSCNTRIQYDTLSPSGQWVTRRNFQYPPWFSLNVWLKLDTLATSNASVDSKTLGSSIVLPWSNVQRGFAQSRIAPNTSPHSCNESRSQWFAPPTRGQTSDSCTSKHKDTMAKGWTSSSTSILLPPNYYLGLGKKNYRDAGLTSLGGSDTMLVLQVCNRTFTRNVFGTNIELMLRPSKY